ncbi:hypothetical protein HBB16_09205 [Pseudonocardia sp. MCCB 268]|nr:hypothetical protein [Pseudonocardia cytotoxica]
MRDACAGWQAEVLALGRRPAAGSGHPGDLAGTSPGERHVLLPPRRRGAVRDRRLMRQAANVHPDLRLCLSPVGAVLGLAGIVGGGWALACSPAVPARGGAAASLPSSRSGRCGRRRPGRGGGRGRPRHRLRISR